MKLTKVELTADELNAIVISLGLRVNYIETGSVTCSAKDAIAMGNTKAIKQLESGQVKTVLLTKELINKLLIAQSSIK